MFCVSTAHPSLRRLRTRVATRVGLDRLGRELTNAVARDLETGGGGANSLSIYESSWVALVRDPAQLSMLAYPETFAWVLGRQRRDGGWGATGGYSVLPTMAALLAVVSHPQGSVAHQRVIDAGTNYLCNALARRALAGIDTPFIELLVPMLAERLEAHRVAAPFVELASLRARGQARRAKLPAQALFHPRSTLVHALEALGPQLDFQRLRDLRTSEGGYGASPAATAFVLLHAPDWDHPAAGWVSRLTRGGGGMPASHPLDIFETAWVLHFLLQGGFRLSVRDPETAVLAAWLRESLTPEGVSMARSRALPEDGDDTATTLATLNDLGLPTSLAPLQPFEAEGHYLSYHGESASSLSTNAHALEALLSVQPREGVAVAGRIASTTSYLLERQEPAGCWRDKWHISPYYATMACVHALARASNPPCSQPLGAALSWIAQSQREDGGWGSEVSTLEETAYALLTAVAARRALTVRSMSARAAWPRIIVRGRRYLQRTIGDLAHPDRVPPMWVDKDLYAPPRIIRAAVLAALRVSATAS